MTAARGMTMKKGDVETNTSTINRGGQSHVVKESERQVRRKRDLYDHGHFFVKRTLRRIGD